MKIRNGKMWMAASYICICMLAAGCSCGKEKDKTEEQVMEITITPEPTVTPAPEEVNEDAVATNGDLTMVNLYLAESGEK